MELVHMSRRPHTILEKQEFWSQLKIEFRQTGTEYDGLKLEGSLLHITDPGAADISLNSEEEAEMIQWFRDAMDLAGLDQMIARHKMDYPVFNFYVCKAIFPFGEMSKEARRLACVWNGWFVHFDFVYDELTLEEASEQQHALIEFNKIWPDILLGKYGSDISEKNYPLEKTSPLFHPYLHLAKQIYAAMRAPTILPHDADEEYIKELPFFKMAINWWSCFEMKSTGVTKQFEDCFRTYQWFATGALYASVANEFLVSNTVPPIYLANDAIYFRLQNSMEQIACAISDLYGIVKDVRFGDDDNLIIFRVKNKGVSLAEAFRQLIQIQNDQARQFITIATYLRKKYAGDEVVERVLALKELIVDGGFRWAYDTPRYKAAANGGMKVNFQTINYTPHNL